MLSSQSRIWMSHFFLGNRLQAELEIQAAYFHQPLQGLASEFSAIQRSYGWDISADKASVGPGSGIHQIEMAYQLAASSYSSPAQLVTPEPHHPDPLMYWGLSQLLPSSRDPQDRAKRLHRLGMILATNFPGRPDLLLQLVAADSAYPILTTSPEHALQGSAYYANTHCSLSHLQALWAKGHYSALHHTYCHYVVQRRFFPHSDFMLRVYTILGRTERAAKLFRSIYHRHRGQLIVQTVSNMLFTELALEQLDHPHIQQLVADFRRLSVCHDSTTTASSHPPQLIQVRERPVLAAISADLRMHPVGRFWLPLARKLQKHFQLVHISFNTHDLDQISDQLRSLSTEWHGFHTGEDPIPCLRNLRPDLLIDLGGHTADNRPGLLNHRFATVQATYLGFYGPSYATNADWWILDDAVSKRVHRSYPGCEPIWHLPGPSLCFDPYVHGLPPLEELCHSEPDHPVLGSFNHTRKLTDTCIDRFASVLNAFPEATLLFRSHSFYDQAVRRWFLRQFVSVGVNAHQLQPIPYAFTAAESVRDYCRIHLHLDSYPVCGTTTTLDSLAMGVPVLTCPNHLYAGAISAALIEQAGFGSWVVEDPADLHSKAIELTKTYRTAASRLALAELVRRSALCDTEATPLMFADQLVSMLRSARL